MFLDQITTAIRTATPAALDDLLRKAARAAAEGAINEEAFAAACEAAQARRVALQAPAPASVFRSPAARQRLTPRSPDRDASLERRRRWAASGALPPSIACRFTPGQIAVVAVVVSRIRAGRYCTLPLDAIAGIAGVSRTLAKDAIREAVRLGVLHVEQRRRWRLPSLTNVITVASPELADWVRLKGGRGQKPDRHGYESVSGAGVRSGSGSPVAPEGALRGRPGPAERQVMRPPRPPARG